MGRYGRPLHNILYSRRSLTASLAFSHGWGEDISKFDLNDARFASWIFVAIGIVWNAATGCIRISMLLLYLRIFPVPRFRQICWANIGLNAVVFATIVLATCLICTPITHSFDKTSIGGHCGDLQAFERYPAVMSLLADAVIVVLPMPMLWRLQMKLSKKIGISIVFGLGAIICILTLTRIFATAYYYTDNYTKSAALVAFITGLEPILGTINACLPFMPLVAKRVAQSSLFQSLRSSSRKLGRSRSSGGKGSSNESENGFVRVHEMVPGKQWRDCGESGKGSSRRTTEESPDRAVPDGW
ncbi:MAG: hypothetical protein L6R38_009021 [Xanthoria sp. 2 TBL-2021]|nr:MAG: hypothetical protein L6R38_009021 [Xanthoria sp. 2 TBL-2021]